MMNKQLFDDAIGEAPPSTVDVDAAIARGRRAARIGRLGSPVVAVSAGVVLVTGAVAATLLSPLGDDPPPAGAGSDQSTCEDPTAEKLPERPEDAVSRLTGALGPLVETRLLAGSQLEPSVGSPPAADTPAPLAFRHSYAVSRGWEPPGACLGGGFDQFDASANVTRNGTTGAARIFLGQHGGFKPSQEECTPSPGQIYCARQTGQNGERILLLTLQPDNGPVIEHRVDIAKPDGTWVLVEATNDASWGSPEVAPPPSAEPPLTLPQLLEIGLDPGMTLYP